MMSDQLHGTIGPNMSALCLLSVLGLALMFPVWSADSQCMTPPTGSRACDDYPAPPGGVADALRDMSAEKRLLNRLLSNYQRIGRPGRPVLNVSTTTHVLFALGLIQMDLDEKHNILTMSMWTRLQWRDEYLTWIPEQYDGIQAIRVDPHLIWIPDITLYNTADAEAPARVALAVVSSDGVVTWYPHTIFKSSCSIDVTHFPFDRQRCHMWFGSWTHTSHEIDLQMDNDQGIDLSTFKSDFKESSAWDIVNVSAARRLMPSPRTQPNYVVLMLELSMKRKVVFSSYILTLPCVFLAFLTLVVFWLPPERPDRTGLAMSTFSSFMLMLLILVEAAPPTTSSIPTLGVYYCFNMVIIMLSIILSSMVVNISRGSKSHVPRYLRVIVLNGIGRVLYRNHDSSSYHSDPSDPSDCDSEAVTMLRTPFDDEILSTTGSHTSSHVDHGRDLYTDGDNMADSMLSLLRRMDDKVLEIRRILQKADCHQDDCRARNRYTYDIREDWRRVAKILDRLFFIVYIMLILGSLLTLFPKPS